jgi:hypothetical protein
VALLRTHVMEVEVMAIEEVMVVEVVVCYGLKVFPCLFLTCP